MSAPESASFIADLFAPHDVEAWSAMASIDSVSGLVGVELAAITPMVKGRRAEYATGRACARAALANVAGVEAHEAIDRDERYAPIWPPSTTGSISHTEGFCIAIAARVSAQLASIGIDIERVDRVGPRVRRTILTGPEKVAVAKMSADDAQLRTAVTFAAKEAFYKAQYQLTQTYLGFGAVVVRVDEDDQQALRFESDHEAVVPFIARTAGRFELHEGRVIAAVAVEGAGSDAG